MPTFSDPARCLRVLVIALLALAATGCANFLPSRGPIEPVHALAQYEDTSLYRATSTRLDDQASCGVRLLPVASYAFATRLEMARRAERTLDVQYYVFKNDRDGIQLMRALRDAAGRGVRVRVIIDDLHTDGEDAILSQLNAVPNVEVRLYNPLVFWRDTSVGRKLAAVPEIERLNHRMHNKLFVADNAAAVLGGRNIADEYFMRSDESNFVDLDIFVAGSAVRGLSRAFDAFWNSPLVYPLPDIVKGPLVPPAVTSDDDVLAGDSAPFTLETLPSEFARFASLPREIREGHVDGFVPARCTVTADPPDKFAHVEDQDLQTVTRSVLNMMLGAQVEVSIVSPYFVPGDLGMEMMHQANLRHGRTVIITNSLASTDSPAAQFGYMRYRKAMLEENVVLRELSPSELTRRSRFGVFGKSLGRLHAKVVLADHERFFIGSMNLDFRSAYRNTEIGLIVDSPQLAAELEALVDAESFYELRLNRLGNIEWVQRGDDGTDRVFDADPETSWWDRLWPQLIGPLIPEKEL